MEGIRFGRLIKYFIIFCFNYGTGLERFVSVVTQNMVLLGQAQLFGGEVVDIVVDDHVVKPVGKLEGVIKATGSTVIERDRQLDFMDGLD